MKIGLFIPCYIDQLYPDIAISTYNILKSFNCDIEYQQKQTCCGQPIYNSGCFDKCKPLAKRFIKLFEKYDYIVAPSGSCISMVKNNYKKLGLDIKDIDKKSFELVEFLHDILKVSDFNTTFNSTVAIHNSCHAHRELNLASKSELHEKPFSKIENLLLNIKHIKMVKPNRIDECCGFGGTFALNEPDVSTQMGLDRIQQFIDVKAQYITGVDISCLMHMQGLIDRHSLPIKTIHISQILAGVHNE